MRKKNVAALLVIPEISRVTKDLPPLEKLGGSSLRSE